MTSPGVYSAGGWHDDQQEQQHHQQEHDLFDLLGMVLASLDSTEERTCSRALHRASSSGRRCAWGARKHLALARYEQGRSKAALLCRLSKEPLPAAAVRAAAAPVIPWGLSTGLQGCARLLSLEMYASQAQYLLAGSPVAAAPGRVLAATLSGLRSLSVLDIRDAAQLREVGCLVGSCSELTGLEVEVTRGVTFGDSTPWLEGLGTTTAAAGEGGEQPAAGPSVALQLPGLHHLRASWPPPGFLESWVAGPAAASLTSMRLEGHVSAGADIACLGACRGLRELHLWGMRDKVKGPQKQPWASKGWELPLPHQLTQLSALTKLVLSYNQGNRAVPPVVWEMQQLRHLDLWGDWCAEELPGEVSSLQQLTFLRCYSEHARRLPGNMHAWPPRLQGLDVGPMTEAKFSADDLAHLTRLTSFAGDVTSVGAIEPLVDLRELPSWEYTVLPPGLTQLTALTVYEPDVIVDEPANLPNPLPLLRRLHITLQDPVPVASGLLGAAQHLTHLGLVVADTSRHDPDAPVQALGVLPNLCELLLDGCNLVRAGSWVQQQPRLTSFTWQWGYATRVPRLEQLPGQLQRLKLEGAVDIGGLPQALSRLTALRELELDIYPNAFLQRSTAARTPLPAWLSGLQQLEVLVVREEIMAAAVSTGVLGQLPRLRQVTVIPHCRVERSNYGPGVAAVMCQAPHLFWAQLSLPPYRVLAESDKDKPPRQLHSAGSDDDDDDTGSEDSFSSFTDSSEGEGWGGDELA